MPMHESLIGENELHSGIRVIKDRDGKIKVLVPVEIDLNMNVDLGAAVLAEVPPRLLAAAAPLKTATQVAPLRSLLMKKSRSTRTTTTNATATSRSSSAAA